MYKQFETGDPVWVPKRFGFGYYQAKIVAEIATKKYLVSDSDCGKYPSRAFHADLIWRQNETERTKN